MRGEVARTDSAGISSAGMVVNAPLECLPASPLFLKRLPASGSLVSATARFTLPATSGRLCQDADISPGACVPNQQPDD
jgi:hypothetical protein